MNKPNFGTIIFDPHKTIFYQKMNSSILDIASLLPPSLKTDCIIFLFNYSRSTMGEEFDFFKFYEKPLWSSVYWLTEKMDSAYIHNAAASIALSMFLHSLDDHLHDREIPCTHLTLMIRSVAWKLYTDSISALCENNDGLSLYNSRIDSYYSVIGRHIHNDLRTYSDSFIRETDIITAVLEITGRRFFNGHDHLNKFISSFQNFAIAYRYLDDWQDYRKDAREGLHTAVYYLLDNTSRNIWNAISLDHSGSSIDNLASIIESAPFVSVISIAINSLLESASSVTAQIDLVGLSEEYRGLIISS
jgi:hypothetical protein